jgi:integrase/recombinase XerD
MKNRYARKRERKSYKGFGCDELEAFVRSLHQQKFSPLTLRIRQRAVMDLCGYLNNIGVSRLADTNLSDLNGYREHIVQRALSVNSVSCYLRGIKRFFDFLEESKRIFVNPMQDFFIPACNRAMQPVPTQDEMIRLLEAPDVSRPCGLRDRAIIEVLYSTGVRRGELLGMKVGDPDFDKGVIRVMGKGQKERVIPLGGHALHWMNRYIKEARLELLKGQTDIQDLWVSKDGDLISTVRINQMVRDYVKATGIQKKLSIHSIRRACVTHMLIHGAHPVQLQMLLGHSSLKTLSQYVQVNIGDMIKTHGKTNPAQ